MGRSLYWRSISSSLATLTLITLSEDEVILPRQELKCLHEQITSRVEFFRDRFRRNAMVRGRTTWRIRLEVDDREPSRGTQQ